MNRNKVPLVPHKALEEVSKIDKCRRGELLWCMDGRANPLMDRKVVFAFWSGCSGHLTHNCWMQCGAVQCNVVVVVVKCSAV